MDAQDFLSLQEAYMDVYQIDEANRGDEYAAAKIHPNEVRGAKQKRRNKSFDAGHTHPRAPRMTSGQENEIENMPNGGSAEVARQKTLMRQRYTRNTRGVSGYQQREQTDLYNTILSHLLDEGYAETPEAAEAIMVSMSEEWRDSIVEALVDHERPQTDDEIEKARNERRFGKQGFNQAGQTQLRRGLHKSERGMKKRDVRRWNGEK